MQVKTSRILSYLLTARFSTKKRSNFAEHKRSLCGGVAATMSRVRSFVWIRSRVRSFKTLIKVGN